MWKMMDGSVRVHLPALCLWQWLCVHQNKPNDILRFGGLSHRAVTVALRLFGLLEVALLKRLVSWGLYWSSQTDCVII